MYEVLRRLDEFQQYAYREKCELFISVGRSVAIQCEDERRDIQYKEVVGLSRRRFFEGYTEFCYSDSLDMESLRRFDTNDISFGKLPPEQMVTSMEGSDFLDEKLLTQNKLGYFNDSYCRRIWKLIEEDLRNIDDGLLRFILQYQEDKYILINGNGVKGFSCKTIFAPGIVTRNSARLFYNVFPKVRNIICSDMGVKKISEKIPGTIVGVGNLDDTYVVFSTEALGQIIYALLQILNIDPILKGKSRYSINDIGSRIFSDKVTIIENSDQNELVLGNCDGEGRRRVPVYIIQNGVLRNVFGKRCENGKVISTASVNRFSHRVSPTALASKVSILGANNQKGIDLLREKGGIYITNLFGVVESFNPKTTSFSAVGEAMWIYENEEKCFHVEVNSSIEELFQEVEAVGSKGAYLADGSVIAGEFIIRNKGMVKIK